MRSEGVEISAAVEGVLDDVVIRRLIRMAGAAPGPVFGLHGKQYLRKHMAAYWSASALSRWVVLVDLDHDYACPVPLRRAWVPQMELLPPLAEPVEERPELRHRFCFRVAVREVEAWLLSDRDRMARFLAVPARLVPLRAEAIADPKNAIIDLARHSREKRLRNGMVPRVGSGRDVGPAYNSTLIHYALDERRGWRPEVAAEASESLRRAIRCLRRLAQS